MKARFADDTLLAFMCPKDQVAQLMTSLETAFSDMHSCLTFTFAHEVYFMRGNKEKTPAPFQFLELNLLPILYSDHTFIIQHTANVKDSSPYSITPYSSAHPDAVKIAKITTSRHRLIILSSMEHYFEVFWQAYRIRLIAAGYPGPLVKAHEGGCLLINKTPDNSRYGEASIKKEESRLAAGEAVCRRSSNTSKLIRAHWH